MTVVVKDRSTLYESKEKLIKEVKVQNFIKKKTI